MTRGSFRRVALVSVVIGGAALANCVDASNNGPGPEGGDGGVFDANVDTAAPQGTDAAVDSAPLDGTVVDANQGVDSASSGEDAADANDASDASDASDAAPSFDDAGCPLPTGVTVSTADAGIPSGVVLWLRADVGLNTPALSM
jgi:hypothetical protein